ncbi:MAG: DUF1684 domain-containing protein [Acidobacteriota bacterium]
MRRWRRGRISSDRPPGFGIRDSGFGPPSRLRSGRGSGFAAAGLVLGVALLPAACGEPPPDTDRAYVEKLLSDRAAKDAAFRVQIDQPIPADKQSAFLPLKYFPPDPGYAVPASFTPAPGRTPVQMPTSTGKIRDMELVGTLEFTLNRKLLSLGAFVEAGAAFDRLFVPFADLTTGTETYPAGRYLEIDRNRTGIYVVDFNRAFNPFCAYNPDYDCPFPPPRNRLPVPVRAGERW